MIQTVDIFNYYINNVELKQVKIKEELLSKRKEKANILVSLKKWRYFIDTFGNMKLDNIDELNGTFKFKCTINHSLTSKFNSDDIETLLANYFKLGVEIAEIETTIANANLLPLKSKSQFNYILKTLKAAIIAEGKTPYKVLDYTPDKEPISNGGEPWIIYHEGDYQPYFYWDRSRISEKTLKFLKLGMFEHISFIPTKGHSSIVTMLNQHMKQHPEKLNTYNL